MTDSTWNAYVRSNDHTALAVRTVGNVPRGRCHGIYDEHLRRGAGDGSPLSFLARESQALVPSTAASVEHAVVPECGNSGVHTLAARQEHVTKTPLARLATKAVGDLRFHRRSLDCFGLVFPAAGFDGDLDSIFHRVFEGHLDPEQAVLVGRFGFVRFHRPT